MDLRELYYLNALAEEQSISKAAERLYIAQASLSQFLRQFEAQLGSPIFVRTNKGIRPTPSGKVFLSHAKHILKEYQQSQQEFWDNENTVGGTVFFGVSSFRGSYVIPPILKKFYDQNPRATINIYEGNSMNLVEKIREGELDLALSAYPTSAPRASRWNTSTGTRCCWSPPKTTRSYSRPTWTRPGGSASRWRKSPAMSASSAARIPCWVT